ncbi:protein SEED AND ROOT HAIR PROTECTIVE PROTEIN-like [Magnolia sinica]|uniref:protein SEED AND ROOT HAIR PROTECTIVE PROTEIN-like n=1 Tax=Magnolia sinica TaxID=86752 RepID=UPI00265B60A2|nr:protein SEED AND ROOT HAIR PROTECTIVE PROTEIN-like [Magnolia sinica]
MALNYLLLACSLLSLSLAVCAHVGPTTYGYGPQSDVGYPKADEDKHITSVGVRGVVQCRSGLKLGPLQGAVVRVTCMGYDENGHELAPYTTLCEATDKNGYFFMALAHSEMDCLSECKAYLESSPSETCNVPTNVNNGMSGALLGSYGLLNDKKMKLCTVGPFVYTTGAHTTSEGY